jgi:D-glycero-D-manno-heptose 1,7-bisphosphate phosphatase
MGVRSVVRAVFLDRDGVLNEAVVRDGKPYPPANAAEMRLVPGVEVALKRLKSLGFLLIVVTNQPDVAKGLQDRGVVEEIHARLAAVLPLDDILVCYHSGEDGCECRKPAPGMLRQAAERHGIDLPRSFLIGDRWRDVEAGQAVGCRTIQIDYGYRERGPAMPPERLVSSISEAAAWIAEQVFEER